MRFEDRVRDHEPKNAGRLWEGEQARKRISPQRLEKTLSLVNSYILVS